MTITNGDAQEFFHANGQVQDYTKALEILEKEYPTRDGLDVDALLDSDKHGALTYNDFLILPGYIGMSATMQACGGKKIQVWETNSSIRFPCI